jgi:probable addiction module antidote protein
MSLKTKKYDVANYLDSDEMIAVYLDAAFESGDTSRIAEALGDVARARGMTKIAKATGLAREQLYKTLSAEGSRTVYSPQGHGSLWGWVKIKLPARPWQAHYATCEGADAQHKIQKGCLVAARARDFH